MAYDETLAGRIRDEIEEEADVTEKKMFGGIAFLLDGKMCCGVIGDKLVARIGPEESEVALRKPHVRPMDFTGEPMKGYIYVSTDGVKTKTALRGWLTLAMKFTAGLAGKKLSRRKKS